MSKTPPAQPIPPSPPPISDPIPSALPSVAGAVAGAAHMATPSATGVAAGAAVATAAASAASSTSSPATASEITGRDIDAPLEDALVGPAHDAYVMADRAYRARQVKDALGKFQEAYQESGDPRLLFYMGQCQRDLGQYKSAIELLTRLQREAPEGTAMDVKRRAAEIVRHARWKVPLAELLEGAAREAFLRAQYFYDAGDFERARLKYEEVHRQSPDPRLVFNIALCQKDSKQYLRALRTMEEHQRESLGECSPEHAARVAEQLQVLRSFVTTLTVVVDQPGASVFLDGEPVGTTPLGKPLQFDFGSHEIRISKPGFRDDGGGKRDFHSGAERLDFKLTPQPGKSLLTIDVTGPGTISIDGKQVGEERWESLMVPGPHSVGVAAEGRRPYLKTLVLADGSRHDMTVALERQTPGWLLVVGASLLVAGMGVGAVALWGDGGQQTPLVGTLSPGTVQLPLRRP